MSRDSIGSDAAPSRGLPKLWNPNATANWSILFTPAFGAYLQMLNWRALGRPQEEAQSRRWFVTSVVALALFCISVFALPDTRALDLLTRAAGLALLLGWYFASGRRQSRYVKSIFGDQYPRRSWTQPLLVALGAVVGVYGTVFLGAVALAAVA